VVPEFSQALSSDAAAPVGLEQPDSSLIAKLSGATIPDVGRPTFPGTGYRFRDDHHLHRPRPVEPSGDSFPWD
jgi:hypothetical protein